MCCPTCNCNIIRRTFNAHIKTQYHLLAEKLRNETPHQIEDITKCIKDYKQLKNKEASIIPTYEKTKLKKLIITMNNKKPSNTQQLKLLEYKTKYPDNPIFNNLNCGVCV
jgi:hypothetical protein